MKEIKVICDCGCCRSSSNLRGWFVISQHGFSSQNNKLKLVRDLEFAKLECLLKWLRVAVVEAKVLEEKAGSTPEWSARGTFVSNKVKGIYV